MISRGGLFLGADVGDRVVREEPAFAIDTFRDAVDEPAAEIEDFGGAKKIFVSRAAQEIRLHLRRDRRVAKAELRLDGQPQSHVRCGHEDLAADDPAGALEGRLEGNVERAFAVRDGVNREAQVSCESVFAEKLLKLFARDGQFRLRLHSLLPWIFCPAQNAPRAPAKVTFSRATG
jgi:hypothetical protein